MWLVYPVFVYTPVYLKNLGMHGGSIGLVASLLYVAGLLFSFPAGALTDRLSVRSIVGAGFLIFSIFPMLILTSANVYVVAVAYMMGALGSTMFRIGADSYFIKLVPVGERFQKFGRFTATGGVGMAFGYLFMGYAVKIGGFSLLYKALITVIVPAILFSILLPELTIEMESPGYGRYLRSTAFVILAVSLFLHTTHFGAEVTSLGIFFIKELKLSSTMMGYAMSIAMLFLALGGVLGGIVGEKMDSGRSLIMVGLILSGAGNLFMALSRGVTGIMLFRIIHELGDAFVFVAMRELVARLFPRENTGGILGGLRVVITVGSLVGTMSYGYVSQVLGAHSPFIISGIISMISAVVMVNL